MSKTTKIIAALGVVAGLGVAALPAFTYAAQVSGNADVIVDVQSAIAMTIEGNNDTATGYGVAKAKNPGTITSLDNLTAQDLANFSNTTATTVSSSHASLLPNASVNGDDGESTGTTETDNGFYSTVTVYTNDSGYTLNIGALSALTKQYTGEPPVTPATIPATGIVKAGISGWGYKTSIQADAADTSTANYDVAAATIKNGTGPTDGGEATIVFYGVSTSPDQENGTYKSTVTYTATTNN